MGSAMMEGSHDSSRSGSDCGRLAVMGFVPPGLMECYEMMMMMCESNNTRELSEEEERRRKKIQIFFLAGSASSSASEAEI